MPIIIHSSQGRKSFQNFNWGAWGGWQVVNGLLVRVLEKAVSGFDFTKTQLTGTVLGFLKRIKKTDS